MMKKSGQERCVSVRRHLTGRVCSHGLSRFRLLPSSGTGLRNKEADECHGGGRGPNKMTDIASPWVPSCDRYDRDDAPLNLESALGAGGEGLAPGRNRA